MVLTISINSLLSVLMQDIGIDPFDQAYIFKRFKNEGITFLTKTLPLLAKSVLRSLELGFFDRPTNFSWKGRALSNFRKLTDKIFDNQGRVLPSPCPICIFQIRQLCEYVYKLALPYTSEQLVEAEIKFKKLDSALANLVTDNTYVEQLRKDFESTFSRLSSQNAVDFFRKNRPRSGPGTFSESARASRRVPFYAIKCTKEYAAGYTTKYNAFSGYFKSYPSSRRLLKVKDTSDYSEVLFVPKDSRGPRTIVREPYYALKTQLCYFDSVTDELEKATDYRINFKSQEINRQVCHSASITKEYCTIDLKDASDSVSNNIVRRIFRNSPAMRFFLNNRTELAKLPSGEFVKLNKLAGMGSGLTFPTMALLAYLSVIRSVCNTFRLPYAFVKKHVYVYGDDIITKNEWYHAAKSGLEKVHFTVNTEKSYTNSHFRESCGADFFYGNDVGPLRLRLSNCGVSYSNGKLVMAKRDSSLVAMHAHAIEANKKQLYKVQEFFHRQVEKVLGPLPEVSGDSSVIGRYVNHIPTDLKTDETGAYCTERLYSPSAKVERVPGEPCPYEYLSRTLKRSRDEQMFSLDIREGGLPYGFVSVPYEVRLKCRAISSIKRLG